MYRYSLYEMVVVRGWGKLRRRDMRGNLNEREDVEIEIGEGKSGGGGVVKEKNQEKARVEVGGLIYPLFISIRNYHYLNLL